MFSQIDNHFVRYCTIINYYCFVRFRQQKTVTWRGFWQKSPRRLGQSSADFQVMWYLVPFVSFIMLSDCTCAGTIRGAATKGCKPADAGPRKCLLWAVLAWPAEHLRKHSQQIEWSDSWTLWSDSTRPWVLNNYSVYVYIIVDIYIYIHLYLYYSYFYIYMYTYIYIFTFVSIYIYRYWFIYRIIYVLYIYICVCVYTHMFIYR